MYTLQNIKDIYYTKLAITDIKQGFDEFLNKNFEQKYDINFNFLGYKALNNNDLDYSSVYIKYVYN